MSLQTKKIEETEQRKELGDNAQLCNFKKAAKCAHIPSGLGLRRICVEKAEKMNTIINVE